MRIDFLNCASVFVVGIFQTERLVGIFQTERQEVVNSRAILTNKCVSPHVECKFRRLANYFLGVFLFRIFACFAQNPLRPPPNPPPNPALPPPKSPPPKPPKPPNPPR